MKDEILGFQILRSKDFQPSIIFLMTKDNLLRNNSFVFCKHKLILQNLFSSPQVEKYSNTLWSFNQVEKQTTFQNIHGHGVRWINSREPKHLSLSYLPPANPPATQDFQLDLQTLSCHVQLPKCQSRKGKQR